SISHGINVRLGNDGLHTLYVIHHGFRETIEVFEIDARRLIPSLTWVGCIPAPAGVSLNGVAPLPDGGLAPTRTFRHGITDAPAALAGKDTGEVHEWQPARGWTIVPGSEGPGPNGIEASRDGR